MTFDLNIPAYFLQWLLFACGGQRCLPEELELAIRLQQQLPPPLKYPAILIICKQTGGGLTV